MSENHNETLPVEQDLDSNLDAVDSAEAIVMDAAREAGFDEDEAHQIGMAVRECMVNAVVHGNRYNAHKKVHFSVSSKGDEFTIKITDQGEGFDLTEVPDPLAEENLLRHSGRGMFLIRAFMDSLDIKKVTPHGTEVTLVKHIGPK